MTKNKILITIVAIGFLLGSPIYTFSQSCKLDNETIARINSVFEAKFVSESCSVNLVTGFEGRFIISSSGDILGFKVAQKDSELEDNGSKILTATEYSNLIVQIGAIRHVGPQLKKGIFGVFSNMRTLVTDVYQNAMVYSGQSPIFGANGTVTNRITGFCLYYFRPKSGVVERKKLYRLAFGDRTKLYSLKIGGRWYYVKKTDYLRAKLRRKGNFYAAGPNNCFD